MLINMLTFEHVNYCNDQEYLIFHTLVFLVIGLENNFETHRANDFFELKI